MAKETMARVIQTSVQKVPLLCLLTISIVHVQLGSAQISALDEAVSFFSNDHLQEIENEMFSSGHDFSRGNPGVSPGCYNSSMQYVFGLIQLVIHPQNQNASSLSLWPILMLDSNGKLPSGILKGNLRWLGEFSQCLDISVEGKGLDFAGQYCALQMEIILDSSSNSEEIAATATTVSPSGNNETDSLKIFRGWCWPSLCNETEVEIMLHFFRKSQSPSIRTSVVPGFCQKTEPAHFDGATITVICIFSIYAAVLLCATVYEFVRFRPWRKVYRSESYKELGICNQIVLSFSWYRGVHTMTSDNLPMDDGSFKFLNGLRALSSTWVIMMGLVNYAITIPFENWTDVLSDMGSAAYDVLLNPSLCIDTLLLVSAFSVAYTFFQQMSENRFSIIRYYLHGIWRMTPVLAMTIAFIAGPFFLTSQGPLWPPMRSVRDVCRSDWWKTILYINNLFDTEELCVESSWYFSLEMQFYVVAPIILYSLYLVPAAGYIVAALFYAATIAAPAIIIPEKGIPGFPSFEVVFVPNDPDVQTFYIDVYMKPWCRMAPYVTGIAIAYLLHRCEKKLDMNWVALLIGWLIAVGTGIAVVFGVNKYFDGVSEMTPAMASAYGALSRPAWALAVGWVMLLSATGQGGYVNDILSWHLFTSWGNLLYSTYLLHLYVMYSFINVQETTYFFSGYLFIIVYLGTTLFSLLAAVPWYLAFEAPTIHLEQIFQSKQLPALEVIPELQQVKEATRRAIEIKRANSTEPILGKED